MVRESYYDRFATLSPEPKVENLKSKNPGKSQLSTVLTGKEALKIEKELPKTPKTAEIMLEGQVVQNPKAYKQDPMLYRQFQLKPEQLQQLNEDEVYYAMPAESAAEALPYPENIPQEMPEQSKDSPTKTASFAESKSQSMLMYASGPIPGPYSYHQSYIAPYGPTVGPSYTNAPHDSYLGPPMVDPRNSYMPSSHAESPFPPPAPYAPGYQPTGYDYNASYAGYPVYPAMNPYLSPNQEHGFPKVPEASQAYPMAQAPTSELFPLNRPENSMDVAKEYQNANEGGQRKGSQEKLLENIMQDNLSPPKRYMYGCVPINRQFRNWCLIIVAGLITVVIILLVLFFPRMPDQRVTNIEVAKDNSFTMTSVNLTSPSISFDFSMNMIMTVNFTNPNYYSLTVDKIDISVIILN